MLLDKLDERDRYVEQHLPAAIIVECDKKISQLREWIRNDYTQMEEVQQAYLAVPITTYDRYVNRLMRRMIKRAKEESIAEPMG